MLFWYWLTSPVHILKAIILLTFWAECLSTESFISCFVYSPLFIYILCNNIIKKEICLNKYLKTCYSCDVTLSLVLKIHVCQCYCLQFHFLGDCNDDYCGDCSSCIYVVSFQDWLLDSPMKASASASVSMCLSLNSCHHRLNYKQLLCY